MIVFTGLSGSGKSSLAFDTIFAEGQRRYVESLSAYARQFLGQMDKPDVDFIEGLSPAVSIDQKSTSKNPRSTVGTITEVYDYLRLLWARIGKPHCPVCGEPITKQTPQQIVDRVLEMPEGTRFQVLAPVIRERKGEYVDLFADLQAKGFARVRVDGVVHPLTEPPKLKKQEKHTIEAVVDRLVVKPSSKQRITDSVETALRPGRRAGRSSTSSTCDEADPHRERRYSERLACPNDHPLADRRTRAALVLVQLAVRRLPGVHRARHPQGGRPGTRRPRPGAVAWPTARSRRGRPGRPASTSCGCCRASPTRSGFDLDTAVGGAAGAGAEGGAARHRRAGARQLPQPLRPRAVLLRRTTRAWCRGSSAATPRPRATTRGRSTRATCARCRARPARAPGSSRRSSRSPSAAARSPSCPRCRSARRPGWLRRLELDDRDRLIGERVLKEINARLGFLRRRRPALPVAGPGGGHAGRR